MNTNLAAQRLHREQSIPAQLFPTRRELVPQSLTSVARDLLRRSQHALSVRAKQLSSRAVTMFYGEPLKARTAGIVMPRACNPERYAVSPTTIDDDVFTAVRCAWAIHTAQWGYDAGDPNSNSAVARMAYRGPRVKLSACLLCDWTGHVS